VRRAALRDAQMVDVPATVLALLGCPIPENFEGRVLTEMLSDDVPAPARTAAAEERAPAGGLTPGERIAVEDRLKGLGYM
jgi:arylsulfatase A-like enzyme